MAKKKSYNGTNMDTLPNNGVLSDMDKGPWEVLYDIRGEATGVISHDFVHDVCLDVSGDFINKDQKEIYCVLLRDVLNGGKV